MPTYEYRCPNGHEFEKFFRSIAGATTGNPCPTCGAIGVRQLSGGAGLMFKGSGFYLTDYGRNAHGKKAPAAPSGGEGSGPGGGSAAGGETKTGRAESGSPPAAAPKSEASSSSSDSGSSTPKPKANE